MNVNEPVRKLARMMCKEGKSPSTDASPQIPLRMIKEKQKPFLVTGMNGRKRQRNSLGQKREKT
jgi:hypothetical protein